MTALAKTGHDNTNLHDTTDCNFQLHASGFHCKSQMQVYDACTDAQRSRH